MKTSRKSDRVMGFAELGVKGLSILLSGPIFFFLGTISHSVAADPKDTITIGRSIPAKFIMTTGVLELTADGTPIRIKPVCSGGQRNPPKPNAVKAGSSNIEVTWNQGSKKFGIEYGFRDDGMVQIRHFGLLGIEIQAPIQYGLLPGFFLEDAVYRSSGFSAGKVVNLPSEGLFALFIDGGNVMLPIAWEADEASICLETASTNERAFRCFSIYPKAPGEIFLKPIFTEGIWHEEDLHSNYFENIRVSKWARPFSAKWKTQLPVRGTITCFTFRESASRPWHALLGFYEYPFFFQGNKSVLHLTKKVPPSRSILIYPVDGCRESLLGFAKSTPCSSRISHELAVQDPPQGSRGALNAGFRDCWGNSILRRTVYSLGMQHREKEFLEGFINHYLDYVETVQKRNMEYAAQLEKISSLLQEAERADKEVTKFVSKMETELKTTRDLYSSLIRLGDRRTPEDHIAYSKELAESLRKAVSQDGNENLPELVYLTKEIDAMASGVSEVMPAEMGVRLRKLFLSSALKSWESQQETALAEKIRAQIMEVLRYRTWETMEHSGR